MEIGKVWKYKIGGIHLEVSYYYPSIYNSANLQGQHIVKLRVSKHSFFGYKQVAAMSVKNANEIYAARDKLVYDFLSKNNLL